MSGADGRSGALFDLEVRVPQGHPLRTIRLIANEALADFHPTSMISMRGSDGRRSPGAAAAGAPAASVRGGFGASCETDT